MRGPDIAATAEERRRRFPGDALVEESLATWTHGVTIAAPPAAVWPWLTQMGAGRGGWYSWDRLDNGGQPSAESLVDALTVLREGDLLPAGPGVTGAFVVERLEPCRDLVLCVPHAGQPSTTWEFLLEPLPADQTRLLVRTRVGAHGWMAPLEPATPSAARVSRALGRLPRGPLLALARGVHRVMQARQLRGIRRRAEGRRRWARLRALVRAENGMNAVGQGGRILLAAGAPLAAAVALHLAAPDVVRIPLAPRFATPLGLALLAAGTAMWAAAVAQLLQGFARRRLVTNGAYGICRNPIYGSVALLVLPGLALVTGTWGYLAPAAALLAAVRRYIPSEERDLLRVFGDEYRRYTARVPRILPLPRPAAGPSRPS